jgi:hypothetical protein
MSNLFYDENNPRISISHSIDPDELVKMKSARKADIAFEVNPQSQYTELLIQDAVNEDAIIYLVTGAIDRAKELEKTELTDTQNQELEILKGLYHHSASCNGSIFPAVIHGDITLREGSMRGGLDADWIMVSTKDARHAVNIIMESLASDEYKHDFMLEVTRSSFSKKYILKTSLVDFTSLSSAAKSITANLNLTDIKLLAWYLGRVPQNRYIGFQDKKNLLDRVEASLLEARKELENQNKTIGGYDGR